MLMAIDWNKELANKGVEDTWEFIKLKYDEVVDPVSYTHLTLPTNREV